MSNEPRYPIGARVATDQGVGRIMQSLGTAEEGQALVWRYCVKLNDDHCEWFNEDQLTYEKG
jgi:hypothetical protein